MHPALIAFSIWAGMCVLFLAILGGAVVVRIAHMAIEARAIARKLSGQKGATDAKSDSDVPPATRAE